MANIQKLTIENCHVRNLDTSGVIISQYGAKNSDAEIIKCTVLDDRNLDSRCSVSDDGGIVGLNCGTNGRLVIYGCKCKLNLKADSGGFVGRYSGGNFKSYIFIQNYIFNGTIDGINVGCFIAKNSSRGYFFITKCGCDLSASNFLTNITDEEKKTISYTTGTLCNYVQINSLAVTSNDFSIKRVNSDTINSHIFNNIYSSNNGNDDHGDNGSEVLENDAILERMNDWLSEVYIDNVDMNVGEGVLDVLTMLSKQARDGDRNPIVIKNYDDIKSYFKDLFSIFIITVDEYDFDSPPTILRDLTDIDINEEINKYAENNNLQLDSTYIEAGKKR